MATQDKTKTTIYYYISPHGENPVKDFIDSLFPKQQVKILRIFQYIEEYGLEAVIPHIRKLSGTKLWEIRILGKDNIRVVYIGIMKNNILVLNGFIKKSQKTPRKEVDLALLRYNNWLKLQAIDK